jgi:beta-apo-4'-carotenal oxygenase
MIGVRYPPYRGKLARFRQMQELKPNFDRLGRAHAGWLVWLLRLGAGSAGGAVLRYLVVLLGALLVTIRRLSWLNLPQR